MMEGAGRSLNVFDFKEEDEVADTRPKKYIDMRNSAATGGGDDDPMMNCDFLSYVSKHKPFENKKNGEVACVEFDSNYAEDGFDDASPTAGAFLEGYDAKDIDKCGKAVQARNIEAYNGSSISPEQEAITSGHVDISYENSQSIHGTAESMFSDKFQEMQKREVIVYPEYIKHKNTYLWDAEIRFSCSSIQVIGSSSYIGATICRLEWLIDDIVCIESHWKERDESAMVYLKVLSISNCDDTAGPSGIQRYQFAVSECDWLVELEKIISLDEKYKPICLWSDAPNPRMDQLAFIERRMYYPAFDESFDEFVFPKSDSDPVTVGRWDLDLLQPEKFINDTIIDFYIKYLQKGLKPGQVDRFHFFNSFFFRKLADLERNQFDASEGRASFLRVRKWTRKVNLFEKDYVFIPVNSSLHWSLVVICHPGEIAKFKDENENVDKVPCILHMDSIKGSHTGLKNHLQSYLWEEWKEKQNEVTEEICSNFFNLRFISLELPQQENFYDCGLFLLHYAELFLAEAPDSFSPFKITRYSNFLNMDWFLPSDVSLKRAQIQRIIHDLKYGFCNQKQSSQSESYDQIDCVEFHKLNSDCEADVEVVNVRSSPSKFYIRDLPSEIAQGFDRASIASSSVRDLMFADDSGVRLMDFQQGTANGLFNGQHEDINDRSLQFERKFHVASMEEDSANGDDLLYQFRNGTDFVTQPAHVSFPSEDFGLQNTWTAMQGASHGIENLNCSGSLICESDDSTVLEIVEDGHATEDICTILERKANNEVGISHMVENNEHLLESSMHSSPIVGKPLSMEIPEDSNMPNDSNSLTAHLEAVNLVHAEEERNRDALWDDDPNVSVDLSEPEDQQVLERPLVEPQDGFIYGTRNFDSNNYLLESFACASPMVEQPSSLEMPQDCNQPNICNSMTACSEVVYLVTMGEESNRDASREDYKDAIVACSEPEDQLGLKRPRVEAQDGENYTTRKIENNGHLRGSSTHSSPMVEQSSSMDMPHDSNQLNDDDMINQVSAAEEISEEDASRQDDQDIFVDISESEDQQVTDRPHVEPQDGVEYKTKKIENDAHSPGSCTHLSTVVGEPLVIEMPQDYDHLNYSNCTTAYIEALNLVKPGEAESYRDASQEADQDVFVDFSEPEEEQLAKRPRVGTQDGVNFVTRKTENNELLPENSTYLSPMVGEALSMEMAQDTNQPTDSHDVITCLDPVNHVSADEESKREASQVDDQDVYVKSMVSEDKHALKRLWIEPLDGVKYGAFPSPLAKEPLSMEMQKDSNQPTDGHDMIVYLETVNHISAEEERTGDTSPADDQDSCVVDSSERAQVEPQELITYVSRRYARGFSS